MDKTLLIVMLVAAAGMIFGLSKQKSGASWGKPVAILCAIIALGCALANIFTGGGPGMDEIVDIELKYQEIAGQKLGQHLAKTYPGEDALVILDPAKQKSDQRYALLEGLKEGLGNKVTVAKEVYPEIPQKFIEEFMGDVPPEEQDESMLPPTEYWLTPSLFDNIVAEHGKNVDMVITCIGLPNNPGAMEFWSMNPRPKLVIASGGVYELKRAIAQGAVAAAVSYNPSMVYDQKAPPSDLDEAFDKRYLLITPENVEAVASKHNNLFME